MRALRLVYRSEDGNLVVETTDDAEQFTLPVDAVLRTAVRAELPRHSTPDPAPDAPPTVTETGEAPVGPREIQMRVRAGESPDEVADAHGMTLERVMRFAGPVLAERARIADEARRSRARRSAGGENSTGSTSSTSTAGTANTVVVFGEAVDERFAAHGIAPDLVEWDSRRRDDGEWIVLAQWQGGGFSDGPRAAEWVFTRSSRFVTPVDDTAADLLSDRPIRPLAPAEPSAAQRASLAAAPPLVPGIVSFPPMPDAYTGPVPPLDEVFDQDAPDDGPRTLPPLVPPSVPPSAVFSPPDAAPPEFPDPTQTATADLPAPDFDEPPLPLGVWEPADGAPAAHLLRPRRTESEDEKSARARVPSWDDILLGVRRKSD